jgi:hypothetical protein
MNTNNNNIPIKLNLHKSLQVYSSNNPSVINIDEDCKCSDGKKDVLRCLLKFAHSNHEGDCFFSQSSHK